MCSLEFGYSNLLQELLLTLLGFSGDVFVEVKAPSTQKQLGWALGNGDAPDDEPPRLMLARDIDWIEDSERQQLDYLLPLAAYSKKLKKFVSIQRDPVESCYAYNRALAAGVAEFLSVYQAAILQLQRMALQYRGLELPTITYYLSDFLVMMRELDKVVGEADRRGDKSGAALLGLLRERAECGIPSLQSTLQRLSWHCNQTLFRHLQSWMLHGTLTDPSKEFFIVKGGTEEEGRNDEIGSEGTNRSKKKLPPEDLAYQEWHQGYEVKADALPHCVTLETADAVLFVGKAVRVLRHPGGAFKGRELLQYSDTLAFLEALRKVRQQPLLTSNALAAAVEGIRAKVAARLWHLAVVQAGLPSHLAALKDYFLLARGDLWQSFLADSRPLMSEPPRGSAATADVRTFFQQSAAKTTAHDDPLFPLVSIRYPHDSTKAAATGPSVLVPEYDREWDRLEMEYKVEWPLGMLLTPAVLLRYNSMFQYLLRLKRVQMELENAWKMLCRVTNRRGATTANKGMLPRLLHLRHNMAHIITNLQIYIQVDVIESNHALLVERIAAAQDFLEAERAHAAHLAALLTQSFLTSPTISGLVAKLFALVRQFCSMMARVEARDEERLGLEPQVVAALQAEFVKEVTQLYFVLDSRQLADSNKAPHLRQFHLRLDYNGYIRALKRGGVA